MPGPFKFGGGAKKGATDFFQLSIAYAKQEALGPIKRQARALGKGIAGSVLLAMGTVLLAIGFVRALQTEFAGGAVQYTGYFAYAPLTGATRRIRTVRVNPYGVAGHLSGDWSWVPYMGGALLCLLVVGFCIRQVTKAVR